jgi:hypothetical protein
MSAGLRPESLVLDMDGDGRVLSADARLILQAITGATAPEPSSDVNAKQASSPSSKPSPLPATAQPKVSSSRAKSPFYVTFSVHFPDNFDKLVKQPTGFDKDTIKRLAQEIEALDVRAVEYKTDDAPMLFRVQGKGLSAYSPGAFSAGDLFSTHVTIQVSGKKRYVLKGALLLKCADVFLSDAELLAKHPKAEVAAAPSGNKSDSGLKPFICEVADGTFGFAREMKEGTVNIAGGPLVKGWSDQMKRSNLQLCSQFASTCAAETALLGTPNAQEKLACLRRFRDQTLARSYVGRALIQCYYKVFSPLACGLMRQHVPSRAVFRAGVELAVASIRRFNEMPTTRVTFITSAGGIGP